MKVPKARKLPSGAYNVQIMIDGKRESVTCSTEKEAVAEAMAIKARIKAFKKQPKKKTLKEAAEEYITAREVLLSPSTVCGYKTILKNRFQALLPQDIYTLTERQCQLAINQEAMTVSAKTLRNSWMFLSAVIYEATGNRFDVRMKTIIKKERPYLDADQIPVFLKAVKGKHIEAAALLALSSLRRSEILDLKWDDIDMDHRLIHVRGAAVYDKNWKLVHKKENKNASSRRDVPMIDPLFEALQAEERKSEYVVAFNPSYLYEGINSVCEAVGLPKVGIHGLRHSFASLAYHLQIPERIAMKIGGWSNPATMHNIYTHLAEKDIQKQSTAFTDFFKNCE